MTTKAKTTKKPGARLGRIIKGTPPKSGKAGTGASIISGKWNTERTPELSTSAKRAEAYFRCYKTDARVSQSVDEHLDSLAVGTWTVEAASKSAADKRIAEFVSACLFGNETKEFGRELWCRPVWPQRRFELGFSLLVYGYAFYQKLWKRVGEFTVLDKLTYIEPTTITLWQLGSTDDLELIQRSYTRGDDTQVVNEEILAKDLALYTHKLVGANYEGISLCRTLYPAFARKEFLEKLKMVAGKRLFAAIPALKVPSDIRPGSEAWNRIEMFLQALTNPNVDTAYFMGSALPEWIQPASIEPLRELALWIGDENAELAAGGGTKGLLLGETSSASRALGTSLATRETPKHNALACDIETMENFGIAGLNSLITELVQTNFPDVKQMPYVTFKPAGTEEAMRNASVFTDLVVKGALHVYPADEMKLREQLGFDDTVTLQDIEQSFADDKAAEAAAVKPTAPLTPGNKQQPDEVPPQEGPNKN